MAWTPGTPAPPLAPPPPERVIWRAAKDARTAEARIRPIGSAVELRIVLRRPDGQDDVLWTCLYRAGQSDELLAASRGVLQDFERFAWQLVPDTTAPAS